MEIVTERQDRVLRIQINRPQKKNAITAAMYQAMAEALGELERDPEACASGCIHGSAGMFTAGNDLGDFMVNPPADENAPVFQFLLGAEQREQAPGGGGHRARGGRGHHPAASLRSGLRRRERAVPPALCAAGPLSRSGVELPAARHRRLPAGRGEAAARRAVRRGRGARHGLRQPGAPRRPAARARAGAGRQARRACRPPRSPRPRR